MQVPKKWSTVAKVLRRNAKRGEGRKAELHRVAFGRIEYVPTYEAQGGGWVYLGHKARSGRQS